MATNGSRRLRPGGNTSRRGRPRVSADILDYKSTSQPRPTYARLPGAIMATRLYARALAIFSISAHSHPHLHSLHRSAGSVMTQKDVVANQAAYRSSSASISEEFLVDGRTQTYTLVHMNLELSSLTQRQREALSFIREQVAEAGRPPTVREICGRFQYRSPRAGKLLLDALERKGY